MDGKLSLKGAWSGHVNHLNFGGHQPSPERLKLEWSNLHAHRLCQYQHKDDKSPLKGAWSGTSDPLQILMSLMISLERLKIESPNFARR